jgi:hypothetical protein
LSLAVSVRGDYFMNIWNGWWVQKALFVLHESPYWTDYLQFPRGISLARHVLYPVNSLPQALLSAFLEPYSAINLVIFFHFAFSGFSMFLLARFLTRHRGAALLAGLVYSFCPYHYYYIAQLNVGALEFLPLAILCMLRVWRDGDRMAAAGVALCMGLLAASSSYYLVYAAVFGGILASAGRLWDPKVSLARGLGRLVAAGIPAVATVTVVAWPLLRSALLDAGDAAAPAFGGLQGYRSNDLLGYNWIGPPERLVVSWPCMLGYSTLLLIVAGFSTVRRQRLWLLVLGVFALSGLGTSLRVAGADTGIPLPYRLFEQLPLLSMLRKPDRCFAMVQLVVALLAGFAWRDVAGRIGAARWRTVALAAVVALVALETTGVPLTVYDYRVSPLLARLGRDASFESVVELPPFPGSSADGRYNLSQVHHGKKLPQGYTVNLALDVHHVRDGRELVRADAALRRGDAALLLALMRTRGVDGVILHKTIPDRRSPVLPARSVVWKPFFFSRQSLVWSRQTGERIDRPRNAAVVTRSRAALMRTLGPPVMEDGRIAVFRLPDASAAHPHREH